MGNWKCGKRGMNVHQVMKSNCPLPEFTLRMKNSIEDLWGALKDCYVDDTERRSNSILILRNSYCKHCIKPAVCVSFLTYSWLR
ncbi:hypothetical protein NPIL_646701 [Nephila pilipes]|uniref:Uncharacterized protein n=1 Tax=Nephila pilipes TaxID=299642 RepID=A0A8X6IIT6_NEPPI|nr:hypothetical protein NPIL_646701 [Nephila pilipes]